MRSVVVRPAAEVDIEVIADYTVTKWGIEQARHDVGDLRRAIESLAANGLRHLEEAELFPGLRRARSGRYFIFYLIDDERAEVICVLHEQRDAMRRLKD